MRKQDFCILNSRFRSCYRN